MIIRMLKIFSMSIVVMISFFVTNVSASNSCTYDISYIGYSNNEEKIRLVINLDDNQLNESWSKIKTDSRSPIDNINKKEGYTNKLEFSDFKDNENTFCPNINYTITKDNNNGFRVYIGNKSSGYLNSVSPSSQDIDDDIDINDDKNNSNNLDDNNLTSNNQNKPDSDESSNDSGLEKIEWDSLGEDTDGTCSESIGEVINDLQRYFNMIKILTPILLIVFGSIDFLYATSLMNNKDVMPKAINKFIKRCIAALAIFFLPMIIEVLLTLPGLPSIEDVLCGLK